MSIATNDAREGEGSGPWRWTLIIVGLITVLRAAALFASPLELYPDEAQYWWWAVHPALGYFSKPPLIAWIIASTIGVFGESEACIRLAAPLFHGGTALLLFALTRRLYDSRTAFLAALLYILLPGVAYSATLISTDVPLLFFWALALLALLRLQSAASQQRRMRWAALCGAAIGFGLLSKYAMAYFVIGTVLAAIWLPALRKALLSRNGLIIAAVAVVVFSPNLYWNLTNSFATAGHLAKNAHWYDASFSVGSLGDFLGGQFGVFGPVTLALYFYGVWRVLRGQDRTDASRLLLCLSLPPLILIMIQAFISEANANWAATAYIAAVPFVARLIVERLPPWGATAALAPNALIALAIGVFTVSPAAVDAAGLANAYKRLHGWRELGTRVAVEAQARHDTAIVADNRNVVASLLYYARPRNVPVLIWDRDLIDNNHFDMTLRLSAGMPGPMLLVTDRDEPKTELATFDSVQRVGSINVALGRGRTRNTDFYEVDKYRGPAFDAPKGKAKAAKGKPS